MGRFECVIQIFIKATWYSSHKMITSIDLQSESSGGVLATLTAEIRPIQVGIPPTDFRQFCRQVTDQFAERTFLPYEIGNSLFIEDRQLTREAFKSTFTAPDPQTVICRAIHIAALNPNTDKDLWLKYNKHTHERGRPVWSDLVQQWGLKRDAIRARQIFHHTDKYFQMLVFDREEEVYKAVSVYSFLCGPERYLLEWDGRNQAGASAAPSAGGQDPDAMDVDQTDSSPPRKRGRMGGSCRVPQSTHRQMLQRLSDLHSRITALEASPCTRKTSNLLNTPYIPMGYVVP